MTDSSWTEGQVEIAELAFEAIARHFETGEEMVICLKRGGLDTSTLEGFIESKLGDMLDRAEAYEILRECFENVKKDIREVK